MNNVNINLTDKQYDCLTTLAKTRKMTIEEYVLNVLFEDNHFFENKTVAETNNGEKYIEAGFAAYAQRDYLKTLECFDKARTLGYSGPGMYYYYAVVCRKLKEYQREIDILSEAIVKCKNSEDKTYRTKSKEFMARKEKVVELLKQTKGID